MRQFIKRLGFACVVFLVAASSCSEDSEGSTTVQTSFEHTFNCEPAAEGTGIASRMTHIMDISSNPQLLAFSGKIESIFVDSVSYSFSIPGSDKVYEVSRGMMTACAYDPAVSDTWDVTDCWSTTNFSPHNNENFIDFRDGQHGKVFIHNGGDLGRSVLDHQKIFTKAIFYFENTDQGYPIDSFDFTVKFFAHMYVKE